MPVKDEGLGIELLTLSDLLGKEPSMKDLDGVTVCLSVEHERVKRFTDGKIMKTEVATIGRVNFWVVLDLGESALPPGFSRKRKDRYIPVGVGAGQDVSDVEKEEGGAALPGEYSTWDEACEASSDLVAVHRIHES